MADQDDFEPLATQWMHTYDLYQEGGTPAQVAQEAVQVVARMYRTCEGCSTLPDLHTALWQFWETRQPPQLWDGPQERRSPEQKLNNTLDRLAQIVSNQRIDAVAVRSAQIAALQLAQGRASPHDPLELKHHLACQITQDLVCHCVLDLARADAVGSRFSTSRESHLFHDQVITEMTPAIRKIGHALAQDPTGQRVRSMRLVPQQTTAAMLFEDLYRLDDE